MNDSELVLDWANDLYRKLEIATACLEAINEGLIAPAYHDAITETLEAIK